MMARQTAVGVTVGRAARIAALLALTVPAHVAAQATRPQGPKRVRPPAAPADTSPPPAASTPVEVDPPSASLPGRPGAALQTRTIAVPVLVMARLVPPVEAPVVAEEGSAPPLDGAAPTEAAAPAGTPPTREVAAGDERRHLPDTDLAIRARALVEQVAGTTVYLGLGTEAGVMTGDTLGVARDSIGPLVGRFAVLQSTTSRSVVTFADDLFAVTRGLSLWVESAAVSLAAAGADRDASAGRPVGEPRAARPSEPLRRPDVESLGPVVAGRISLDVDVVRSETTYGPESGQSVERTLATPTMRLHTTVSEIPGGFTFRGNGRASYRYANQGFGQTPGSFRLYNASLEKRFESLPLEVQAGRFYNRYDGYSGYWDGVMARVGSRAAGVGVVAGFEPDRWNQAFSTEIPKITAFADYSTRGAAGGYQVEVSAHRIEPRGLLQPHTFFGLSQRARVGRVRLGQDLQLDRDPASGDWRASELQLDAAVDLDRRVSLHAGLARLEPYRQWDTVTVFSYVRERANVGISAHAGRVSLGADIALNRDDRDRSGASYGAYASLPRLGAFEVNARASLWEGDGYRVISASPGASLRVGRSVVHAGYRYYHSDYDGRAATSHSVDAGARFNLGRGLQYTIQGTTQWGADVLSNRLYTGFAASFR